MPPRRDDEAVGFLITDTARLLRAEFDRAIAAESLGITPGEARTLAHVGRASPVRQSALAERMGLEAMTLSTYLDRLEERGLVTRNADPTDRRAKLVTMTDSAAAVLTRIHAVGEAVRKEAAAGLSPEDWAGFVATLKQLRDNLHDKRHEASRARAVA